METIGPCKYCDHPRETMSVDHCYNCWEVSHRIAGMTINVLQKILTNVRGAEQWLPR